MMNLYFIKTSKEQLEVIIFSFLNLILINFIPQIILTIKIE